MIWQHKHGNKHEKGHNSWPQGSAVQRCGAVGYDTSEKIHRESQSLKDKPQTLRRTGSGWHSVVFILRSGEKGDCTKCTLSVHILIDT